MKVAMAVASCAEILDIRWISQGWPITRGMIHVVMDAAALHGEPFRWGYGGSV